MNYLVNIFGGFDCGKSKMMYTIASELSWKNINVEIAPNFAKDLIYEERFDAMENQVYIFGNQLNRIQKVQKDAKITITNSPLLLSLLYKPDWLNNDAFKDLVLEMHNMYNNINYFIKRFRRCNLNERQTEAIEYDAKIIQILNDNKVEYKDIPESKTGAYIMIDDILNEIQLNYKIGGKAK